MTTIIATYNPVLLVIGIVFILWLLCLWQMYDFATLWRMCRNRQVRMERAVHPSVTIVIVAHDQESTLAEHLSAFLHQTYGGEYEVVVVDVHSKDGTKELLEHLESIHPHLSHTSVPSSARDISLQRLAITLGLRAAVGDWVVLTRAECYPVNEHWLEHFMHYATPDVDVVEGLSRLDAVAHRDDSMDFFHLWQRMMWMSHAKRHRPYRTDENVMMLRRDAFLGRPLFAQSSHLMGSVHSLLLNHEWQRGRTIQCLDPAAMVCTQQPSPRIWKQEQTFFMEERTAILSPCLYRLKYAMHILLPRFMWWMAMGVVVFALLYQGSVFGADFLPHVCCGGIGLALSVVLGRYLIFRATARALRLSVTGFAYPFYAILLPYWDLRAWLVWKLSNKKMFRKKFI